MADTNTQPEKETDKRSTEGRALTDAFEERQHVFCRQRARLNENGVDALCIFLGVLCLHLPVFLQIFEILHLNLTLSEP